jgi:hypothetical protein
MEEAIRRWIQQFALPLPEQRFGHNQQDAPGAFSTALGNDQAGLNRFPRADLIREDATAFAKTPEREDDRVNLVGIGVNAGLSLRGGIPLPFVRTTNTNEVLS